MENSMFCMFLNLTKSILKPYFWSKRWWEPWEMFVLTMIAESESSAIIHQHCLSDSISSMFSTAVMFDHLQWHNARLLLTICYWAQLLSLQPAAAGGGGGGGGGVMVHHNYITLDCTMSRVNNTRADSSGDHDMGGGTNNDHCTLTLDTVIQELTEELQDNDHETCSK